MIDRGGVGWQIPGGPSPACPIRDGWPALEGNTMKRLNLVGMALIGWSGFGVPSGLAQGQYQTTSPNASTTGSSQAPAVQVSSSLESTLLQTLRAIPATAPFPFATEPRGSKILLLGRVNAKIVHDVAIRTAIDLGVPVEDGITIDTAFRPGVGVVRGPGFGPVPGPGPVTGGNIGFGGPPAFGNYGLFPGNRGPGYGAGGYGAGVAGGGVPPVLAFPSAGSYGGAPSLLPPPLFGRYDDPFYGLDPPAVVYPPWWGALNAQRTQANAAFESALGAVNGVPNGAQAPNGPATGAYPGQAGNPVTAIDGQGALINPVPDDPNSTNTDIGPIPDGTVDMEVDNAGVATIRGGIPSEAEKLAVGQRIAGMPGVNQVVNLLTIKPSLAKRNEVKAETPPPFPTPVEAAAPADANPVPIPTPAPAPATATAPSLNPAPGISQPAQPTNVPKPSPPAIDPTSDNGMTDRATRALEDRAATLGPAVKVKAREGVAYLSGKVASVYEAMLAYRTVQQLPGIRSVDDRLEFPVPDGSPGSNPLLDRGRPDDVEPYLEAQLRRQVGNLAHIDRVRLQADTLDVRGILSREEDRDRFDAILRSMPILRGFQVNADLPAAP